MRRLKIIWDAIPAAYRLPIMAGLTLLVFFSVWGTVSGISSSIRLSSMRRQVERAERQVKEAREKIEAERRRADEAAGEAGQLRKQIVELQSRIDDADRRLAQVQGRTKTARERYYEKPSP